MREVARLANVSAATVSRVLNGSTSVGEQHRRRVLDAIARTDYRPNRLARNMRRQQAEMIGVVVPASLDDAARNTLDMVRRNVDLETRLIDDLLDVTRIAKKALATTITQ